MEGVIKVCACVVISVLASFLVKGEKNHFGFLIGVVLGVIVFGSCFQRIRFLIDKSLWIRESLGGGGRYLGILMRMVGITYVCDFSAGICRDSGYGFLAGQLETLGKLMVMISGLPVLTAVIEQISHFV